MAKRQNLIQIKNDVTWLKNNIFKHRRTGDLFIAFKDHKKGKVSRATFYRLYAQAQDQLAESSVFSDQGPEIDRLLNEAIDRSLNKIDEWHDIEVKYRNMMDLDWSEISGMDKEKIKELPNMFEKAIKASYVQMAAQRDLINILEKAGKIVSRKNLSISIDPEIVQLLAGLMFIKVMEVVPDEYGDEIVTKLESLEGKSREQLKLMATDTNTE